MTPPRFTHPLHICALLLLALAALFHTPRAAAQNTHRAALVRASSQYFSAADSVSLSVTGDMTIEAWVKPLSQPPPGGHFGIVDKSPSSYFFTYSDISGGNPGLVFSSNGTPTTVSRTLTVNQWHHLALAKQGTLVTFFVNGVAVGTGSSAASITDDSSELRIGNRIGTVGNFDGYIDEVRLWSSIRTQAQIRTEMFSEINPATSGLRAHWKLNNSLADATTNGNTLALSANAPTFATNDLPFSARENHLPFCVGSPTKHLYHLDGNSADGPASSLKCNIT